MEYVMTWKSDDLPPSYHITVMGWVRVVMRGVAVGIVTFGCLVFLLVLRLIERPLFGQRRPVTPYITQFVCRVAFLLIGIRYTRIGIPMVGPGAVVANHTSWLDIFALNASKRIYFVSKSEVAGWPGIGWLARATGTVFIARDRSQAVAQVKMFRSRLSYGHKLLFFPEGTSTDGQQVIAFKPTLFAAFFDASLRDTLAIQPVSVVYCAPIGFDERHYGWWGEMNFATHLLKTLAQSPQGGVTVIYHNPVKVADFKDRKALAAHVHRVVRDGHLVHRCGEHF
ncbi:MAG: 1-acyl-sn-glycerol-3-phosphate acyltransferase [Alteromonas macleodii]|jgi:1-acyl-sn-glycerol-3-phosphate acyltransferase